MSIRVSSTSLISGAVVVGDPGLGVLAQDVPSTGDSGAGYAYAYLSLPADNGKEVRGLIVIPPIAGTLTAYEDTSFVFDAPDGEYSFTWQLYLDGVASGDPHTETLIIGETSGDITAPVVSSLSAIATGTTTATLTVTTDEGNGSIFFLIDANATATEAAILAGLSQSVTATGEQMVNVSALDAATAYYAHVLHRDAASNVSNILHSAQFTTDAYVYPIVTATASAVSATEVSATATTTKAGGTISAQLTTSATAPDAADIIADHDDTATVTDAGEYSLSATGLTFNTQYYWHIVHVDGESLESSVITVPVRTLDLSITLDFPDTAPCSLLGYQVWSKLAVTDEEIAALWSA